MKKPLAVAKIDAEMSLIPVRAHILCSMTNAVSSVPCHQHCLLSKVRAPAVCMSTVALASPASSRPSSAQQCNGARARACFDSVNNLKEDQIETLKQIFSARASAQGYGDGYQCIKRKQSAAFYDQNSTYILELLLLAALFTFSDFTDIMLHIAKPSQNNYIHCVANVQAVLSFYNVKCLYSGGRE